MHAPIAAAYRIETEKRAFEAFLMNFDIVYPRNLDQYLAKENGILIDVRSREEYMEGHWCGARNFPYEDVDRWEKMLPGKRRLVFYCSHGGGSMQLARRFGMQGYRTATVIGGYPAMMKYLQNK